MDIMGLEPGIKFVTAGISLFALFFSGRALQISRRALITNHRSWLVITEIEVLNVHDEWSHFAIKLENIGKLPAQFQIDARLSGAFSDQFPSKECSALSDASQLMALAPGQTIFVEKWPAWEDRKLPPPRLYVWVFYKDALSRIWRRTEVMYWIGSRVSRAGVNSLEFDAFGNAGGEALLTNQKMT